MPYPKKLLNDHETVALDLHPHWWSFAEPAFALAGAIVLGIVGLAMGDGGVASGIRWVALVLIIGCAVWLLKRYVTWASTNFVITSDRIIFRTGVVSKRGIDIPLERVNNVLFNQNVFERMIGAGDLLIESGGETGQQRFSDVRNPARVQNLIYAQIDAVNDRRGGFSAPTTTSSSSVADQLEKLEGLRERGTLTQEEFEEQKRRLLET